ncbi:hypothetical protein GSI01S_23_00010 [Gordonia sihwensis NBRC 108236]|uniref:Uncharacterized protein n=1 Tax=Gordonia sihwensis NBRC 108236 TaxID=1223544 RepID=L7LNW2_9ACTN|nr:hypothetical protein GSI01S_23_00010 [Gordonia sihwensis NBRC 108236]
MLPARAGMVPPVSVPSDIDRRAPRASGDGPPDPDITTQHRWCSPRERGWSFDGNDPPSLIAVLPARAGMVPKVGPAAVSLACAPRASGDGPDNVIIHGTTSTCSPRERGWSGWVL